MSIKSSRLAFERSRWNGIGGGFRISLNAWCRFCGVRDGIKIGKKEKDRTESQERRHPVQGRPGQRPGFDSTLSQLQVILAEGGVGPGGPRAGAHASWMIV